MSSAQNWVQLTVLSVFAYSINTCTDLKIHLQSYNETLLSPALLRRARDYVSVCMYPYFNQAKQKSMNAA